MVEHHIHNVAAESSILSPGTEFDLPRRHDTVRRGRRPREREVIFGVLSAGTITKTTLSTFANWLMYRRVPVSDWQKEPAMVKVLLALPL